MGGEGGADGTAATDGDATPEGERPWRTSPPGATCGGAAAHVFPQAQCVSAPPISVVRPWSSSDTWGGRGVRCSIGGDNAGGTLRHAVACQWPSAGGRGGGSARPRRPVARAVAPAPVPAAAPPSRADEPLPPFVRAAGRPLLFSCSPAPGTGRRGAARRPSIATSATGGPAPRAHRHRQPRRRVWPTAAASPPLAPTGSGRKGGVDRR